ncbi:MAG: hypothetical protein ABI629_05190 [bacterium]
MSVPADATQAQMRQFFSAVTPYWAGEAEIVERYFARGRTRASDIAWLTAQAAKECYDFRVLPAALQDEYVRRGRLTTHPDGASGAERLAVEMGHAHLLIELLEELCGAVVDIRALRPLPEDEKLYALRAIHRSGGGALENAAVDFTEGGGGAMYLALSRRNGDAFERQLAAAFAVIYRDELTHGPMQIHGIARAARDAADWARAAAIVRDISMQRLHMRNEMFGWPLSAARLAAIGDGAIEPWPVPIAL